MATQNPASTPVVTAEVVPKGQRNYLVMMLLAVLMLPSGLARAYRGEQIGWIRFWIYVGATVLSFIPFINILAALVLIALSVWGVIDVFKLYKVKTDAEGGALATTPRDEKFAKAFWILTIVGLALTGLGIILAIIFGAFFYSTLMNSTNNFQNMNNYNNPYNSSQQYREYDSMYR